MKDKPPPSTFELFVSNLRAMREWYRCQDEKRSTPCHAVIQEVSLSNVETAMDHALQGKIWQPPQ